MKDLTGHFASASYFRDSYSISRSIWRDLPQMPRFLESVRFGYAVRRRAVQVAAFVGGAA